MIQADAGGTLVILLVAGIYGLVNYVKEKMKAPPPVPSPKRPEQPRLYQDEVERERRFLEALGMPAQSTPKKRGESEPMRQSMSTASRRNPPPAQTAPAMPPRLPRTAPPPLRQPEFPTLPTLQTPETPAFANLETPDVPLFQTVSSRISAAPQDLAATEEASGLSSVERRGDAFRDLLRDRASIRSAFLLREILGPPRGLPSEGNGPTVPIS